MINVVVILLKISLCDACIGILQVGNHFQSGYISVTGVLVAKEIDVGFVDCHNQNRLQCTIYLLICLK